MSELNNDIKLGNRVFIDEKSTRIEPVNYINSIEEGLQARIKDPLWILGRQWQTGEFQAQNGGQPVRTEIVSCSQPINQIKVGYPQSIITEFDLKTPLEMMAEREGVGLKKILKEGVPNAPDLASVSTINQKLEYTSNSWDPTHLEYNFEVMGKNVNLIAKEYDGTRLDWFNFILAKFKAIEDNKEFYSALPSSIEFFGMPNARWWEFEEKSINIGSIQNENINYIMMALMEFCLLYSNDWFSIQMPMKAGYIREIKSIKVTDTFGVTTYLQPAINTKEKDWASFSLTPTGEAASMGLNGSVFYAPNNILGHSLESEALEEVSIIRDELANFVWAVERKYQKSYDKSKLDPLTLTIAEILSESEVISRDNEDEKPVDFPTHYLDKKTSQLVTDSEMSGEKSQYSGPLEKFNLMSNLPDNWIPYQAMRIKTDQTKEQITLRRSKTKSDVSAGNQYKGRLIQESVTLAEEEIPRGGLLLQRIWQLARDENKNLYVWRSRKKTPDIMRRISNLRFDYVEKKGGEKQ